MERTHLMCFDEEKKKNVFFVVCGLRFSSTQISDEDGDNHFGLKDGENRRQQEIHHQTRVYKGGFKCCKLLCINR